ncbi:MULTISPECIES: translation initiation factor IF-2 [Oceanobacillus]|uniref:Translation initiation factor IF-2 n=1 Tax=Oceanobacillus kimchii TaxID=746691 RepID=A0ABQ5THV3_9BACI|nr:MULTISPECIES: translation initiation factor IF-2 [Oceanobacillus]MBT2598669.1 translation initiation factor IF-2 [Oceanobacillus sp. ISL-74]MBT2651588.1 translation initiation factor IF-2 [Oceanobacillus sp. ISL-73]MCT1576237.1 translation initiation factor IF-2 [Oceanobacillus kimchii]MCT2135874.1 translation initiation factor IF-2 [Oceanobacillus kimchii]OEH54700.1 translation initiation factor IF-2 [Oceanobacillus sp. E9]
MSKIRIYEYAKQNNIASKEVINFLKTEDVEVTNHMSAISDEVVKKLDNKFKAKPEKADKEQHQPKKQQQNKQKPNQHKQKNQSKLNKNKKQKGPKKNQQQERPAAKPAETPGKITYHGTLTVQDLADKLNKESAELIKKLMFLGVMATKNQDIDDDAIELICGEYGVEVEKEIILEDTDLDKYIEEDAEEDKQERPAVVTIMGHVDHGKTTLLDSIRHTKVTAGEAGGITQHIGAYQVENDGKKITFLDTPGHAAFTSMRSRGAQITDIAILVVAADDGVMPQTVEAINHAKAAEVPIIVAVNKMDKEGANPDRVMQELTEHELIPEDWGGNTIFVNLSAIKNEGIDDLLEMILLVSEVEELKANPNAKAFGSVIDAQLDKGRGSVATLLVQNGTLRVGDPLVVGNTYGKVRAMVNDIGNRVTEVGPSTPVEITGLHGVPQAGDQFLVFKDEKKARQIGEAREQKQIDANRGSQSTVSLDDLFEQIKQGEMKELNIIVKADVQGSVEALAASLQKIEVEGVNVKIIHTGVGAITESDIILASASKAIVIGFNVRPDVNAKNAAESEKVDLRLHRVIYNAIEEIESAMKGLLDPEYEEKVIGQAEVRETFKVSRIGTIAGSYVTDGKITRDAGVRLIRDGVVLYEGELQALKRFKDDVKEVQTNYECGITISNFNDIKEGDIIEAFVMEEIERK